MRAHWTGLGPGDVMLHAGAINWTYTLGVGVVDPLSAGGSAVLYNGHPDPAVWPRLIDEPSRHDLRRRARRLSADPQICARRRRADLSSLRHGLSAGAALAPSLLDEWRARTGKEIYEAFGMSECSTFISSGPSTPVHPGSPGRPQPGRVVAALPREGGETPLPSGETGVLAVRRDEPGLMLRYWNRPEEEREAFRGDWFVSGDLVEFDAEGYMHHHGRADEVMNAGGYRVSPAEVEKCLLALRSCRRGRRRRAARPRRGDDDHQGLCGDARWRGAGRGGDPRALPRASRRLQAPAGGVFLDALPRNANGKLKRARAAVSRPHPTPADAGATFSRRREKEGIPDFPASHLLPPAGEGGPRVSEGRMRARPRS